MNALQRLKGLSILLVEDSAELRDVTRTLFECFGARVLLARQGREALEILARETPDLILCDLCMPEMDGFEFIQRLRGDPHRGRLRVLAVSGLGSPDDRRRALEAGFDAHLPKPLDVRALSRLAARHLRPPRAPQPGRAAR